MSDGEKVIGWRNKIMNCQHDWRRVSLLHDVCAKCGMHSVSVVLGEMKCLGGEGLRVETYELDLGECANGKR